MITHYALAPPADPGAAAARPRRQPVASRARRRDAMEIFVDEGLNTTLGLTAPPRQWPWQAHARGFAAHAVYGAALGLLLAAGRDD